MKKVVYLVLDREDSKLECMRIIDAIARGDIYGTGNEAGQVAMTRRDAQGIDAMMDRYYIRQILGIVPDGETECVEFIDGENGHYRFVPANV